MRRIFETGLERLGRIVASQHNIDIVFGGNGAYTDGKTIHLPSTGDLTPELQKDMHGFLDHEVGHCRHTDFDEFKKSIKGKGGRFNKELLNATEDIRIERLMIDDYPGCRLNLDPLRDKYSGKAVEKWKTIPWPLRFIYSMAFEMEGREVPEDEEVAEWMDLCEDERAKFNDCTSTEEVNALTKQITKKVLKKLEDEKADDEDKDGEEGDGDGEEGDGEGSSGEGDKKGKGKGKKKRKPSAGDKLMDDGEGDSDDEKKRKKEWDKHDLSVGDMMDREVKKFCKDKPHGDFRPGGIDDPDRSRSSKPHIPATTQFDKEVSHVGRGDHGRYNKLKAAVYPHVSSIRRWLERTLKVQENVRWRQERERGMINARSLSRLACDPNYRRPFKELSRVETNNVAVEILIDMSGSMHGSRIETAKMTAIALAEALNQLQIPFEVTGFHSTHDSKLSRWASGRDHSDLRRFNRVHEVLETHVFKSFESAQMSGLEKIFCGHQNPDGEAVKWAANRLALMRQKRKILMVLSDGQPATGEGDRSILRGDLYRTVKKIIKSGMEVVGIGIQTTSVKEFYPDHVVINRLEDLPKEVIAKLAKIIARVS
jgi:cobalamin biosynthesis protein CobT